MSRLIPLTQGQYAIVDDADFAWLSQWKWHAQATTRGGFYANRRGPDGKMLAMHRVINATPDGMMTDHIDGDGLNNQRANLRTASPLQNMMNRKGKRGGSSRYKGVWADPTSGNKKLWRAGIRIGGRLTYLGRFATEAEAAAAYARVATQHFGEFANATPGASK